jgi:hypothetical protein
MEFAATNVWSLAGSIVSVVLGILAIGLSIYFFVQARNTETKISSSLTKIETQAEMLQRITGRQLDRLTRYVTDQPMTNPQEQVQSLLALLVEVVPVLQPRIAEAQHPNAEGLTRELISCYIGLYYYAALANFWSQFYLPPIEELDSANQFHVLVQRAVDQSAADFTSMADVLTRVDQAKIHENPLAHVLEEAIAQWRDRVRTSTQVYAARS